MLSIVNKNYRKHGLAKNERHYEISLWKLVGGEEVDGET
jgi:hypothetical protein